MKMENQNDIFEIDLEKKSIHKLEYFVDEVCNQLMINDTYSGNILVSVTELFNLLKEYSEERKIIISYKTDYQAVKISIKPIDNQFINNIISTKETEEIDNVNTIKSLYLVKALSDGIEVISEEEINLVFDISAVHSKVYEHRVQALSHYFDYSLTKPVKSNDSF